MTPGYSINSVLHFGKFKGQRLHQIISKEPGYINWCIINLDHFYIMEEDLEEIRQYFPNFQLSEEAMGICERKEDAWHEEQQLEIDAEYAKYEEYDYEDPYTDGYVDDCYGGSSWGCSICDGDDSTGCLYFDPTECPR